MTEPPGILQAFRLTVNAEPKYTRRGPRLRVVAQFAQALVWGQPPSAVRRAKLGDFSVPHGKLSHQPSVSGLPYPELSATMGLGDDSAEG
jgi:hypothetical protein